MSTTTHQLYDQLEAANDICTVINRFATNAPIRRTLELVNEALHYPIQFKRDYIAMYIELGLTPQEAVAVVIKEEELIMSNLQTVAQNLQQILLQQNS